MSEVNTLTAEELGLVDSWRLPDRGTVGMLMLILTESVLFLCFAAAYLIYIGIRKLTTPVQREAVELGGERKLRRIYSQGVVVAILNPKTALFFLAFLPQFIETPRAAGYGFGASVTIAGLIILPMLAAMAAGGMISGPIHHRIGFKAQLAWGSAFLGAGALGFAWWNAAASNSAKSPPACRSRLRMTRRTSRW